MSSARGSQNSSGGSYGSRSSPEALAHEPACTTPGVHAVGLALHALCCQPRCHACSAQLPKASTRPHLSECPAPEHERRPTA
eukprot:14056552-Alexandrium_andersonii.AAC.1